MPFNVPSLEQLKKLSRDSIVNAVAKGRPIIRRTIEDAIGNAVGAVQYLHLERLLVVWDQLWPDTATGRWLDRHASMWGLTRKDAGPAGGKVRITGVTGNTVPLGTSWTSEEGFSYTTLEEAEIPTGEEVFVLVEATTGGAATRLPASAELSLDAAIAGVDDVATVIIGDAGEDGLVGGSDLESDDDLRVRVLARIQNPPEGGSVADYIGWALEVPGVTRAWAIPWVNGPGTVLVLVVDDNSDPITPGATKLAEVLAYLVTVAPATDVPGIVVAAPVLVPVDHQMILSPNTATVQSAVDDQLDDFYNVRELGADVKLSQITGAIDAAPGEDWNELQVPAADVVIDVFELAVRGPTTTYVDPP